MATSKEGLLLGSLPSVGEVERKGPLRVHSTPCPMQISMLDRSSRRSVESSSDIAIFYDRTYLEYLFFFIGSS